MTDVGTGPPNHGQTSLTSGCDTRVRLTGLISIRIAKGMKVAVFLTKGGKLVVVKGRLDATDAIERYAAYDGIDEVAKDPSVSKLAPTDRARFVEKLRKTVGGTERFGSTDAVASDG